MSGPLPGSTAGGSARSGWFRMTGPQYNVSHEPIPCFPRRRRGHHRARPGTPGSGRHRGRGAPDPLRLDLAAASHSARFPTGEKTNPFPTVTTQPASCASFPKRRARSNRSASVSDARLAPSRSPIPASQPSRRGVPAYHAPPWSTNPAMPSPTRPEEVVGHRDPVLGGREDRAVAGEGVAPEGARTAAESQVELRAGQRILDPSHLDVERCRRAHGSASPRRSRPAAPRRNRAPPRCTSRPPVPPGSRSRRGSSRRPSP